MIFEVICTSCGEEIPFKLDLEGSAVEDGYIEITGKSTTEGDAFTKGEVSVSLNLDKIIADIDKLKEQQAAKRRYEEWISKGAPVEAE